VLGTTDYVSPEQALGRKVTGQSDLYSLGVVLYEALTGTLPFVASNRLAVATMHVRDQIPDVQRRRPELSAIVAATIERATAKPLDRRYGDARAMLADLEAALAIETARSGTAGGEASAVLRTLPRSAARGLPLRVRHPGSTALSAGAVALVVAAVAILALTGVHANRLATHLAAVSLAGATATSYNPFGSGPDNANLAARAIDGKPGTTWMTSEYADGALRKPGVGIYVTLARPTRAAALTLVTSTPGFDLDVLGADRIVAYHPGSHQVLSALGWRLLGRARDVPRTVSIRLRDQRTPFRYYLVWITRLEPGAPGAWVSAAVGEVGLLARRADQGT
jgi:serine/threonine-protein kinase